MKKLLQALLLLPFLQFGYPDFHSPYRAGYISHSRTAKEPWTNYHLGIQGDGGLIEKSGSFLPGDTLFIDSATAGLRTYIYIAELHGTPANHVVIANNGYVHMRSGIEMFDCNYLDLVGSRPVGAAIEKHGCGIWIEGYFTETVRGVFQNYGAGGMVALRLHGDCRNVNMLHIEVSKAKYGSQVKNDEECDSSLNYPNGVMDSVTMAYGFIHFTESQGAYWGTTNENNSIDSARVVSCFGHNVFPNPGRMGNLSIHDMWIDSTGRAGIQISVAQIGTTEIYNNHVKYTGGQTDDGQGGGITTGSYTHAIIHDNSISNSLTYGILCYGSRSRVYHNRVDSSGWTIHTIPDTLYSIPWARNIAFLSRGTVPVDSNQAWCWNNILNHAAIIVRGLGTDAIDFDGSAPSLPNWGHDNRHKGNTYAGVAIGAGSNRVFINPSIHVAFNSGILAPLVNAERDYVGLWTVKGVDTTLYGSAKAMGDVKLTSHVWSQVSGPGIAVITSPSSYVTTVTRLIPGDYIFKLTVTDSQGQTAEDDMLLVKSLGH